MKIKNSKKFCRSMLIILSVIIGIGFIISNTSLSHSEQNYKTVYISDGDTLWDIAKDEKKNNKYYAEKDIRDIVNSIKKTNNLNGGYIYSNQKLQIPTV